MPAFRVDANAANASGTLGVCNIQDPEYYGVYDTNSYSNSEPSAYNRVYFGQVPASNDNDNIYSADIYNTNALGKEIYWRVLNTHANDIYDTPALFMLTEYILTNNLRWDNTASGQKWASDSEIKTLLNDTTNNGSVYNKCFQAQERNIIMQTQNGETTNYNVNNRTASDLRWVKSSKSYYAYGCGLTGERLFLLSAKEVTKEEYGFMDTTEENYHPSSFSSGWYAIYPQDTNRIAKPVASTGDNSYWWLRSTYYFNSSSVTRVNSSGYSHGNNSFDTNAIRFALNIPLSKVIFAQESSAKGASPSSTFVTIPPLLTRTKFKYTISTSSTLTIYKVEDSGDVAYASGTTPDGAKLTILDESRSFFVDTSNLYVNPGETINLHYSGTVAQGSNGTEYISAIIKEVSTNGHEGNGLYYARLMAVGQNTSGNVSMTIPQDIPEGIYTLIVYNELDRGEYKTNYAGYTTVVLNVIPPPNLTSVYMNEAGNNLKLTLSGGDLSHISTLLGEKILDISKTNINKNLYLSENTTGITLYDQHGHLTSLYTNDVAIDKTPPIVTVTHSSGTYTITVSDNESGVWKITNGDGTKVYHDYS